MSLTDWTCRPCWPWLAWLAWLAWLPGAGRWALGAENTMARGYVGGHMFKDFVTGVPEYKSISWV